MIYKTEPPPLADSIECDRCRGRGMGAYLTDYSGLDDFCPKCNGHGRVLKNASPKSTCGYCGASREPIGYCCADARSSGEFFDGE